ncbi:MAG: Fic family protein [Bacilli bacterium]|nr:Fic family protein [Bacilli bacterium]
MDNLLALKNQIETIKTTIDNLFYGSVEIRQKENKKYIYVHFRNSGILQTKYVGEYSDELYNLILSNNIKVKELKKRLKELEKELRDFPDTDKEIEDEILLNIDLARRNLVDSIYKQSILEGVATTYSDTETIVNEGKVRDMSTLDVQKIINLKHAWEFIMDYDVECCPTNYALLCQINALVEEGISYNAGKIRSTTVTIGGSSYIPPIPFEFKVKEDIEYIINNAKFDLPTKAARLIAYTMKTQTFIDGNKRTAVIFGNHFLISHGVGLMVVPVEKIKEYKTLLLEYYEDRSEDLIEFFVKECFISLR